jgi:hypothetical protein
MNKGDKLVVGAFLLWLIVKLGAVFGRSIPKR